jgi:hypothetical protein
MGRVEKKENLTVYVVTTNKHGKRKNGIYTKNIVYKELLS